MHRRTQSANVSDDEVEGEKESMSGEEKITFGNAAVGSSVSEDARRFLPAFINDSIIAPNRNELRVGNVKQYAIIIFDDIVMKHSLQERISHNDLSSVLHLVKTLSEKALEAFFLGGAEAIPTMAVGLGFVSDILDVSTLMLDNPVRMACESVILSIFCRFVHHAQFIDCPAKLLRMWNYFEKERSHWWRSRKAIEDKSEAKWESLMLDMPALLNFHNCLIWCSTLMIKPTLKHSLNLSSLTTEGRGYINGQGRSIPSECRHIITRSFCKIPLKKRQQHQMKTKLTSSSRLMTKKNKKHEDDEDDEDDDEELDLDDDEDDEEEEDDDNSSEEDDGGSKRRRTDSKKLMSKTTTKKRSPKPAAASTAKRGDGFSSFTSLRRRRAAPAPSATVSSSRPRLLGGAFVLPDPQQQQQRRACSLVDFNSDEEHVLSSRYSSSHTQPHPPSFTKSDSLTAPMMRLDSGDWVSYLGASPADLKDDMHNIFDDRSESCFAPLASGAGGMPLSFGGGSSSSSSSSSSRVKASSSSSAAFGSSGLGMSLPPTRFG